MFMRVRLHTVCACAHTSIACGWRVDGVSFFWGTKVCMLGAPLRCVLWCGVSSCTHTSAVYTHICSVHTHLQCVVIAVYVISLGYLLSSQRFAASQGKKAKKKILKKIHLALNLGFPRFEFRIGKLGFCRVLFFFGRGILSASVLLHAHACSLSFSSLSLSLSHTHTHTHSLTLSISLSLSRKL